MFRKLGIGFAALTMLAPGLAAALGVGDYQLKSYLNQPFEMEVELIDARDLAPEEVLVSLAPQQEFDAVGIERSYFLTDLEFEVTLDGQGGGTLRIYSTQPVREPYLSFLIEFLWPTGRLMREYTVLLDPPSYAEDLRSDTAETAASSSAVVAQPQAAASAPVTQEAAAAEPRVIASSQAASAPIEVVDRQEYVVQTDDTMWRIALNNRPAQSISVQQMLLAIQSLNEDAFIDGNVNLVREGTVLRLPTEEEVRRVSTREALGEIAEQNREWRARLEARGIRLPTRPQMDATGRTAAADTGGDVAPQTGEVTLVAPTDTGSDGAASGTGTGSGAGGDSRALENELAIRDERADQLRRQNEELSSRLNDLTQQVETSEQLLKLRNDQIAKLQDELRKLQEAQGLEPTEPVVVEPVTPTDIEPTTAEAGETPADAGEMPADAATETATADTAMTDEAAAEAGAEGEQATAEPQVAQPVTTPEPPKPVIPPAPIPQPSFLEENLMLVIAAGAAVVVLVFGGLFMAARRRRAAADSAVQDEDLAAYSEDEDDFFASDMGAEDDDIGDAFAEAPSDSQPAAAGQDPLEEVDVYTAYGRHAEAVTFLKNEINKSPERADLKVRLLEVLAEMRDVATFEREAQAFAGQPDVERRLPDLRAQLGIAAAGVAADAASEPSLDDLEFDLASDFDSKPSKPAAADDDDATLVLDSSDDLDFSGGLGDETGTGQAVEEDMSLDFGGEDTLTLEGEDEEFTLDLEDEAEPAVDSARQQELDDALSVEPALNLSDSSGPQEEDIDFGEIALEDASEEFSEVAETPSTEELDLSLDDLDLGGDEAPAATPAAEEELSLSLDSDDELSLGGDDELSLEGDDELSLSLEDDADELSLDLDTPDTTPDATVQRSAIDDLDLGGAASTDVRPAVEAQPQGLSLDDEEDFEFLGDADENATKLDLAKAYIDMGDAEGARDILGEVIAEGNSAQQAEAKELLAQVS